MKVVACYVRVSTVGQNLSGQKREIKSWLIGNGFDPDSVRWYVDKETGDTLARPAFDQLQRDVFAGQVGTVVCWKLDRLSRKLRDGVDVLCQWCDRGVRVVSVTQNIDFSGPTGRLIASVLFAVAEMEQETRRERQRAGIAAARERGVYCGRKPGTLKAKPGRAKKLQSSGLTHSEIGQALGISRRTVIRYLSA